MRGGQRISTPEGEATILGPTSTPGVWWARINGVTSLFREIEAAGKAGAKYAADYAAAPSRPQPNTTPKPVQTPLEAIQQRNAEHPPDLPPCFGEQQMPTRRSPAPRRPYTIDGIGL